MSVTEHKNLNAPDSMQPAIDVPECYLSKLFLCCSVLLFPPLPSRLRFLIHKTTLNHPDLTTFSVGDGWARRTVLCHSHLRLHTEEDCRDTERSSYQRPHCRGRGRGGRGNSRPPETTFNNRRGARRPDKPVYVPRAIRQNVSENLAGFEQLNLNPCENSLSTSEESSSDDIMKGPLVANQEPDVNSTNQSLNDACDQTVPFLTSMPLDDRDDENCSNTVVPTDETIQPLDSEEIEQLYSEIKANLKHKDVVIQNTCNDYSGFATIWLNQNEFSHVIEIYDFPNIFKTDDLLDAFVDYSEGGMKIKWVNDTHALGVFSSQAAAEQVLSLKHPLLKTRPLSEGSQKAKWKAMRRAEFIQPVKERPRTDTEVARRMVTRALGLRGGSKGKL
ncbi:putative R3H and coiled-coil domain-containing protein 1-like [Triplophysa rosa]|uniref:R3H and coiled-coil domain-containing protein 1-like n=2 Tax=Triplophysa rosa TaxID=992332 RepID=A0A9W7T7R9_TRIRA|nr:putative R3H and coiled-coil domain-containing protein 1-like [Triplophysa rosa]